MRSFLKGWSIWEAVWLVAFSALAIWLSVLWGETWFGFSVFITGVICVVLVAKGSIWNYAWGIYNVIGYAYLAYNNGYFGELMLNAGFFLPIQVFGFFMWKKYMDGKEVKMKRLNLNWNIAILIGSAVAVFLYGQALSLIQGQNAPYLDSMSTVLSVIAMFLMIYRYAEQWLLWMIVNVVSIVLWVLRIDSGVSGAAPMIAMWSAYLVNSLYGYIKWMKNGELEYE